MVEDARSRVGIVIRTKNRPWFLARALRDLGRQDYPRWEAVIVNDAGDRGLVDTAVAALPAADRARIRVIGDGEAMGRSAAANRGIAALDSEYVVLHDDDDLWAPAFLARTVAHLDDRPDEIGVMVRTEIVYERPEGEGFVEVGRAPYWPEMRQITYADLLQVNRAVPISFLYRRAIHDDVGGYREDLHAVEDWELYLRIAVKHDIGFIDGMPLAYWMQRTGVEGDMGNSMFALAAEHDRYDRIVRDEALRAYVRDHGPGLPLYLARYVQDEIARQLDVRRTLGQRATEGVKSLRRRIRGR